MTDVIHWIISTAGGVGLYLLGHAVGRREERRQAKPTDGVKILNAELAVDPEFVKEVAESVRKSFVRQAKRDDRPLLR